MDAKTDQQREGVHLRGIVCEVRRCVYHDGDTHCTAKRITVGPSFAKSAAETVCATFRAKTL